MTDKIQFRARIPALQSAITLDGSGDGGRIKLEVPRTDVMELMKMQRLSETPLIVTVEVDPDGS